MSRLRMIYGGGKERLRGIYNSNPLMVVVGVALIAQEMFPHDHWRAAGLFGGMILVISSVVLELIRR